MRQVVRISVLLFLTQYLLGHSLVGQTHCAHAKQMLAHGLRAAQKSKVATAQFEEPKVEAFWNVNMDDGRMDGRVIHHILPKEDLSQFVFQLHEKLEITEILVDGTPVAYTRQVHDVFLNQNFLANTRYAISIAYNGFPEANGFGSYVLGSHQGVPVLWTLSQPYGAKDWWPCVQQLNYKIDTTVIHLSFPEAYRSGSNGLLQNRTVSNGVATETWVHQYPVAHYLIAIAITNYAEYTYNVPLPEGDLLFQNLVYPESLTPEWKSDIDVTADMLVYFDSLFTPYPFIEEKYGHAQFSWGGGMEHQTMSFMIDFDFDLVAHELAHMWFGDLVTCNSWQDLWLNEGFATFCTALTLERLRPKTEFYDFLARARNRALKVPNEAVYVQDTLNIGRLFSQTLTYGKGALVLQNLRHYMGEENFFAGLRDYLNTAQTVGFATTDFLASMLKPYTEKDLSYFFDRWIFSPGHPDIDFSWQQNNGAVQITAIQTQEAAPYPLRVPVEITGENTDTTVYLFMDERVASLELPSAQEILAVIADPNKETLARYRLVGAPSTLVNETFEVYPNPAAQEITLKSKTRHVRITGASLIDAKGKAVRSIVFETAMPKQRWNLDGIASGSYTLRIQTNSTTKHLPLVVAP